jgi:hypothetical protein
MATINLDDETARKLGEFLGLCHLAISDEADELKAAIAGGDVTSADHAQLAELEDDLETLGVVALALSEALDEPEEGEITA